MRATAVVLARALKIDPMTLLYFEDVELGDSYTAGPISSPRARSFSSPSSMIRSPATSIKRLRRVPFFWGSASSAHTFSIFVLLTTKFQPRLNVLAGMGWDELKLPNAVRPNDELDLKATVLEKRESRSKPDRGIIRNQIHLRNQKREMVLQCISNILVARRPIAKAST
jgi:hypothetical protein